MKILTSQVSMDAHTSRQLDHKVSSRSNIDFKSFLVKDSEPEEGKSTHNVHKTEQKEIVDDESDLSVHDLLNKFIIEILLSRFLGREQKEVKLYPDLYSCCQNKEENYFERKASKPRTIVETKIRFEQESTQEYYKKNAIEFKTKAVIKTADKELDIDLNLSYTQEFYESYKEKISFEKTVFIDPLIIHYDLSSNYFDSMSDELTFEFDINSKGDNENIPLLKEGSGFLALDKNSNGTIDNGTELFGPNTNKGFNELKEYDEDHNSWIDENDSIFSDLRIWSKNEKGDDTLVTLGNANVGAIYLGDVASTFNYDKSVNEGLAHLKRSSIFLTEEGKAGLVTSVDFAVS